MLSPAQGVKMLLHALQSLGRLPADFDPALLVQLATHPHEEVRLAAVKALARLENPRLLPFYQERIACEDATLVRRELVSAVGRLRLAEVIPTLQDTLHDSEPKVILQAIRRLLVFREEATVREALQAIAHHPNELVRAAIQRALTPTAPAAAAKPHTHSPRLLQNLMACGDVLEVLRYVPDESVHLTFTSLPYYNARAYTLYQSYEEYPQFLTRVFREVHRITKEGRLFVLNTSPVLIPRMSRQHASKRNIALLETASGWRRSALCAQERL